MCTSFVLLADAAFLRGLKVWFFQPSLFWGRLSILPCRNCQFLLYSCSTGAPLWKWQTVEATALRITLAPLHVCLCFRQHAHTRPLMHSWQSWVTPCTHLWSSWVSLSDMNVGFSNSKNTSGKQSPPSYVVVPWHNLVAIYTMNPHWISLKR